MKKLIYLILISFCLFSPLQAQDVILPFSKILSWLDADSIHCRVFYADSIIAGVVITDYSYLSADSIITASFTVWDTTTGFKFVDFQGVQRKAFIDSLGVRELTVTDSAYIDTLTIEVLKVLGKAIIDDSLRNNGTFRQFLTATFGTTATPVVINSNGAITTSIGGSSVGLSIDGNKTTGNLAQFINDNNGAVGDSSVVISSKGYIGINTSVPLYSLDVTGTMRQYNSGTVTLKINANDVTTSRSFIQLTRGLNPNEDGWDLSNNLSQANDEFTLRSLASSVASTMLTVLKTGNIGIGTSAPVKKLHVKGDVAIGDTATATNERFLYFAGDGNTMQHNVKHINTGTGFSGFYFSDSISADGYIDYCEYYEGNALNAVASVKKELGSSSKQGFAKLNHNSLPTGVRTTFDLSYWKRKSDSFRMHDGFKPVMSIDPVWIVTPDTSYWQQPTDEDKINYVGNFDLVKEPKPGRNISRMVSLLTKAVQELQAENTLLKERLDKLEKP